MRKILYAIILVFGLCKPVYGKEQKREIKALILIVASDDDPVYIELQKFWRLYMHSDPDHIEVYFVKANPNLPTKVQVIGDTIWCQTPDGFCHQNCGIIMKTLYALEHFLPKIRNGFDYVMRTNLSTFCIFPRFLNYLETLPKTRCYAGTDVSNVASGTGIILSPDMVELLIAYKDNILTHLPAHFLDDITIGNFFHCHDIQFIRHNLRIGIYSPDDWNHIKDVFPPKLFQVHIRTDYWEKSSRVLNDLAIHTDLLKMFYSRKEYSLWEYLPF